MIAMAIACEPKLLIADEPHLMSPFKNKLLIYSNRCASNVDAFYYAWFGFGRWNQVIVMRHGEIREQGLAEQSNLKMYIRELYFSVVLKSTLSFACDQRFYASRRQYEQSFDVSEIPQRKRGLNGKSS